MAKLTGEAAFKADAQRYLDYWTVGYKGRKGQITPGGLAFIFFWASLRMAANTAFVALVYADYLGTADPLYARYHDFAKRQIDYALGDNPRAGSYMVGFGANPPRNPHHRGAHGAWTNAGPGSAPTVSRHVLYGALVGGPDASDGWADDRGDFVKNEVALDFNSGITSSLARLHQEFGGNPLATLPTETPDGPEITLERGSIQQQTGSTNVQTFLVNRSAWPARVLRNASMRYYFTLDGATTPAQITVSSPYTNCQPPTGPTQHAGSVYYVTISCAGTLSFPGGQSEFRREAQLVIRSSGTWDPGNDWSATSVGNMTLYDDAGALVFGTPPGGSGPVDTTPPSTPGTPTVAAQSSSSATLTWAASTDNVGVTGYLLVRIAGTTETVIATPATNSATVEASGDVVYSYAVYARDAAGNRSTRSGTVQVFPLPVPIPPAPGTPVATDRTTTSVSLTWTQPTSSAAVAGYTVVRIDDGTETVVATPTANSATITGLGPATIYVFAVYARTVQGVRSPRSGTLAVSTLPGGTTGTIPPTTPPMGTCRVAYSTSDWSNGFTATVTITNTGTTAINGWTLRFAFPGGQQLSQGWSAAWSQSGANVTATNASWNGTLAPGASTQLGFNATHTGSNPRPTAFTLNTNTCTVA